jgi:hypothetical protein
MTMWQWDGDKDTGAGYVNLAKGVPSILLYKTLTATTTGNVSYTSASTLINTNSVLLKTSFDDTASKTYVNNVYGSFSSNDTMVAIYEASAQMTTGQISGESMVKFTGLPNYIGISTTLSAGITAGTSLTISILPISL